jgi:hypothetical protein
MENKELHSWKPQIRMYFEFNPKMISNFNKFLTISNTFSVTWNEGKEIFDVIKMTNTTAQSGKINKEHIIHLRSSSFFAARSSRLLQGNIHFIFASTALFLSRILMNEYTWDMSLKQHTAPLMHAGPAGSSLCFLKMPCNNNAALCQR